MGLNVRDNHNKVYDGKPLDEVHSKACHDGELDLQEQVEVQRDIVVPCTYKGLTVAKRFFSAYRAAGYDIEIYYIPVNLGLENVRNNSRRHPTPSTRFIESMAEFFLMVGGYYHFFDKVRTIAPIQSISHNSGRCVAVYPGSFDPPTIGHLEVIQRISKIFDEVVVCICENTSKNTELTLNKRYFLLKECVNHLPNTSVDVCRGLISEYMDNMNYNVIVKGVRNSVDFSYETTMARINKELSPYLETLIIESDTQYAHISSSLVKELRHYGNRKWIEMIPEEIRNDIPGGTPTHIDEGR